MSAESNISLTLLETDRILIVKVMGNYFDKLDNLDMITNAIKLYDAKKLLLDFKEGTYLTSPSAVYSRPNVAVKKGFTQELKIAILVRNINSRTEIVETIFKNKGFQIELFVSFEEAIEWLNEKTD
jgi:hypothetical protein